MKHVCTSSVYDNKKFNTFEFKNTAFLHAAYILLFFVSRNGNLTIRGKLHKNTNKICDIY